MSVAVCPGSFDPITLGHINVIKRASRMFDRVIVCIMVNAAKKNQMFTPQERAELARRALADIPNVEVDVSDALLAEYAKKFDRPVIVKGLRNSADFDYEYQIALVNNKLDAGLETLFIPAQPEYGYISSTVVRELASYGAELRGLVSEELIADIEKKATQWRR